MVAAKSPARGQSLNKHETMQGKRWRGGYDAREKWSDTMGVRRSEGEVNELSTEEGRDIMKRVLIFFLLEGTGKSITQSEECHWTRFEV